MSSTRIGYRLRHWGEDESDTFVLCIDCASWTPTTEYELVARLRGWHVLPDPSLVCASCDETL